MALATLSESCGLVSVQAILLLKLMRGPIDRRHP